MTCPNCGALEETGRYCSECGAELRAECEACGARLTPEDSFCAECGAPVGGRARSRAPWIIAGAAAIVVVLILLIPERAERAGPLPATDPEAGIPMGPGTGFTGDMRVDADRLFNRVMTAAEQGQVDEVNQFMPMAIQAHEAIPDLDHDGLFHLAILYQTAGSHGMAIATAERILADVPTHILALGVGATSSEAEGDTAMASAYYRRLVDAFPGESDRMVPEYRDHRLMMDEYHRLALQHLDG